MVGFHWFATTKTLGRNRADRRHILKYRLSVDPLEDRMLLSINPGAPVPLPSDAVVGAAGNLRQLPIFVNTSDDVVDFGGAQQVADLPGPDGKVSLSEAGLASDNTPGVQTIGFHIPQNEWLYQQFFPGRAVLKPFLGFRVFDTAILDGRTQTAFTGETNPDGGAEVVIWSETYLIDNVDGGVFGFDNSSIHLSGGSGNVIQGNTKSGIEVYASDSNLIGGSNPGQGNTGGHIQIDRANDNVVVGNTTGRVRVLGWMGGGQTATNNRIGGPSLGERNFITGLGTLNSEGIPSGFAIQLFDSMGTVIENNWIGTTPDGMQKGHPWTTAGIYFDSENHDTTIRGNRIAGILARAVPPHGPSYDIGSAIQIYGTGSGVAIIGNKIGLNANDEPVLGSVTGISTVHFNYPNGVQNVVIGGSAAGEGNEIAGHLGAGISVANTYSGVRISGNSIHDNGSLGIDLITSDFQAGVTLNDPLDWDTGGNNLQNYPVLAKAFSTASGTVVRGTLNSSPNTAFTIEFFLSPAADPTGYGEGQIYLGQRTVTTGADGNARVAFRTRNPVPVGYVISATATDPSGSTSEFGPAITVGNGPTPFEDEILSAPIVNRHFNDDGQHAAEDIDAILAGIAGGSHPSTFDLTVEGLVNLVDRDIRRAEAGFVDHGQFAAAADADDDILKTTKQRWQDIDLLFGWYADE